MFRSYPLIFFRKNLLESCKTEVNLLNACFALLDYLKLGRFSRESQSTEMIRLVTPESNPDFNVHFDFFSFIGGIS
jgi:hypothetical protein